MSVIYDCGSACPSRLPENCVCPPRLAQSQRMVYRPRSIRYVGGVSLPEGREGQPACSSATSTSSPTARAFPRSLPWSPFVCPRGPILGRIGPRERGRSPPLTCGDAVEPPIGIEPITSSLRVEAGVSSASQGRCRQCLAWAKRCGAVRSDPGRGCQTASTRLGQRPAASDSTTSRHTRGLGP